MLPAFYLLMAMQGFCLYHAYQNRTDQKWYYIILFIPYIGCLFYLYDAFFNRSTVTEVTETIKHVVNSNYKIEQLEKEAQFNDSATNNMRLADAYMEIGRHAEAAQLYDISRVGFMTDDEGLKRKLIDAWYRAGEFEKCVALEAELKDTKAFRNSLERVSLAWALHKLGRNDEAQKHFDDMNRTFSNYAQRYSYCEFLIATSNLPRARELAGELATEFEMMKGPERRLYREIMRQVANMQQSLGR